jgi:hypothetical protein
VIVSAVYYLQIAISPPRPFQKSLTDACSCCSSIPARIHPQDGFEFCTLHFAYTIFFTLYYIVLVVRNTAPPGIIFVFRRFKYGPRQTRKSDLTRPRDSECNHATGVTASRDPWTTGAAPPSIRPLAAASRLPERDGHMGAGCTWSDATTIHRVPDKGRTTPPRPPFPRREANPMRISPSRSPDQRPFLAPGQPPSDLARLGDNEKAPPGQIRFHSPCPLRPHGLLLVDIQKLDGIREFFPPKREHYRCKCVASRLLYPPQVR